MVPDGRKYGYKECSATDYKSVYPELSDINQNAIISLHHEDVTYPIFS